MEQHFNIIHLNIRFFTLLLLTAFILYAVIKLYKIVYFLIGKEFLNNMFSKLPLEELDMPSGGSNVLIFVPHPDDEIAGCCAFIKKCIENKCNVKVVMTTNGDGVGLIDTLKYKLFKPSPEYFEKLAYTRQDETKKALRMLGLDESNIVFLGYPDRCSVQLWRKYWDTPFTSTYTKRNYSFYNNSFTPNAPYTGINVASDMEKIITQFKPTHIVYPHFYDCHVDHFTTNNFVRYAISKLDVKVTEYTYLIHRGNWPTPPIKLPYTPLRPPKALSDCGIKWYSLPLSLSDINLKEKCILTYKTQTSNPIMKMYLFAFLRRNELFGVYKNLEVTPNGEECRIINPFADTLTSYLNRAADICCLSVHMSNDFLTFKLDVLDKPQKPYTYMCDIFFFDKSTNTDRRAVICIDDNGFWLYTITQNSINLPRWTEYEFKDNSVILSLPLRELPAFDALFVNALSFKGSKIADRTGTRLVKVNKAVKVQKSATEVLM